MIELGSFFGRDLEQIFDECGITVNAVEEQLFACVDPLIKDEYDDKIQVPLALWRLNCITQICMFGYIYWINPVIREAIVRLSHIINMEINCVSPEVVCIPRKEYELGDISLILNN